MRTLFTIILSTCSTRQNQYNRRRNSKTTWPKIFCIECAKKPNHGLDFTEEIYNEALIFIEDLCLVMYGKLLAQLGKTIIFKTIGNDSSKSNY